MRGTLHSRTPCPHDNGIIPAYAGNTDGVKYICFACTGSSPRMRGTPTVAPTNQAMTGIIPAYAGNTRRRSCRSASTWDHPRVCGEHSAQCGAVRIPQGSSPRMRGTRDNTARTGQTSGIIPAYAGNTRFFRGRCTRLWDHPRVCGEHGRVSLALRVGRGSSPRMRGTHVLPCGYHAVRRIIPAYAGNTTSSCHRLPCCRDHPRVCGEHGWWKAEGVRMTGSSPRMRGTPTASHRRLDSTGIIPAYAGNTLLAFFES